ncbi:MAG: 3-deoxy-manno-octulosonate cytidylyltransferase [Alphaproteobacteria bacterium]
MKIAIIIPARYGSSRFPGKPLAKIAGKTMLQRVVEISETAATDFDNVSIFVTTEDQRIADHAKDIGVPCILTSPDCPTGSDRALEAIQKSGQIFDFIINLQGDAPFTTPETIAALIYAFQKNRALEVVTPAHLLTWDELDRLRENKKTTPFSGTTITINEKGRALWFSKNIIPALRTEDRSQELSPVFQHIGLYGFRRDALEKFCALQQSPYEKLEGLEQLRLLENGIAIHTVKVDVPVIHSGIDSPEDLQRAEKYFSS